MEPVSKSRRARLSEAREKHLTRLRAIVAQLTRPETPAEMQRRLKCGWDWRNGGRAAREKAKQLKMAV